MARAVDSVCIAVQSDGAALSPLALAADFCLTTLARVDVDALLQAPSALAVARARIGDVVLVRDVAFGDLVRDGSDVYLPSLLANLRQAHSRARASALQRKLELRMALLHREEPSAANDE
jgi:hypothetical protein